MTEPGRPHPLGATVHPGGVNFSFFSAARHRASNCCCSTSTTIRSRSQRITLDPDVNKTFHFWHVYVRGLKPGDALRATASTARATPREQGHRFNRNKVLIDPYAKGNTTNLWDRGAACGPDDNLATSMRSVVLDPRRLRLGGRRAAATGR